MAGASGASLPLPAGVGPIPLAGYQKRKKNLQNKLAIIVAWVGMAGEGIPLNLDSNFYTIRKNDPS